MVFELPVVEQKVKPQQVTALHLLSALALIGSGAIFCWLYQGTSYWGEVQITCGAIILILAIFRNKWLISDHVNRAVRMVELVFTASLLVYCVWQHLWIPVAMFGMLVIATSFALYWERAANSYLYVRIDQDGIKTPVTARRRFIEWDEVESILLRFGTLTINCDGNRLFQWSIDNYNFEIGEFEAFCNKLIAEGRTKRKEDDW